MKTTRPHSIPAPARRGTALARSRRGARPRASEAIIELVPATLKLGSILVPVDFSEPANKALAYARRFASQFGARLTLLSVVEPVLSPDFAYFPLAADEEKVVADARDKLDQYARRQNIEPELVERTLVRAGTPFQEICAAARGLKSDLIVIATHGHTGLKHVWLGSTAERVVRHAPCPVLVVRAREREFVMV